MALSRDTAGGPPDDPILGETGLHQPRATASAQHTSLATAPGLPGYGVEAPRLLNPSMGCYAVPMATRRRQSLVLVDNNGDPLSRPSWGPYRWPDLDAKDRRAWQDIRSLGLGCVATGWPFVSSRNPPDPKTQPTRFAFRILSKREDQVNDLSHRTGLNPLESVLSP